MNLAYIPSPSFSELHLGPLTIRMYALCILIGIFVAMGLTIKRWKTRGGSLDQVIDVSLITIPFGIIGARLYHVITTPERFFGSSGDFTEIFRIWNGGLGIWGAVALGGLAAWAWCRWKKYSIALLADAVAPGLLLAQAIGRLGNWFNQELFGKPTNLSWGLKIDDVTKLQDGCYTGQACPSGTLFHPTFLYELIWNVIGACLLIYFTRLVAKKYKAGSLFALYVIWYTLGRAWVETVRIDYAHIIFGERINVWVSLGVALCGFIAFTVIQRIGHTTAELSEQLHRITRQEQHAEKTAEEISEQSTQEVSEESATAESSKVFEPMENLS